MTMKSRRKIWIPFGPGSNALADAAQDTQVIINMSLRPDLVQCNILRIVGVLAARSTFVSNIAGHNCAFLGLKWIHQGVSAAEMPRPGSDLAADWIWHLGIPIVHDQLKTTLGTCLIMPFDVKSNRRNRGAEQDLVSIFDNQSSAAMTYDVHGRILVALH